MTLHGLEFIDREIPCECDICDNVKVCARIFNRGDVLIICKDCLIEFTKEFEKFKEE